MKKAMKDAQRAIIYSAQEKRLRDIKQHTSCE